MEQKELARTGAGLNLESEGNLLYSFSHRSIGFERPSVICCGMSHFLLSLRTGTTPATLLHKPPVPIFLDGGRQGNQESRMEVVMDK